MASVGDRYYYAGDRANDAEEVVVVSDQGSGYVKIKGQKTGRESIVPAQLLKDYPDRYRKLEVTLMASLQSGDRVSVMVENKWRDGVVISRAGSSIRVRLDEGREVTSDKEWVRQFEKMSTQTGPAICPCGKALTLDREGRLPAHRGFTGICEASGRQVDRVSVAGRAVLMASGVECYICGEPVSGDLRRHLHDAHQSEIAQRLVNPSDSGIQWIRAQGIDPRSCI